MFVIFYYNDSSGFWENGILMYTAIILVANYKVYEVTFKGKRYIFLAVIISLIIYFGFLLMFNGWFEFPLLTENIYYGIFGKIFLDVNTYLKLLIIFALTSLLDVMKRRFKCTTIFNVFIF